MYLIFNKLFLLLLIMLRIFVTLLKCAVNIFFFATELHFLSGYEKHH